MKLPKSASTPRAPAPVGELPPGPNPWQCSRFPKSLGAEQGWALGGLANMPTSPQVTKSCSKAGNLAM